ncbi:helix-turn-helix domain-containing protein [Lysobacter enzymogenes]|uniref:helix-turn-helix domain-containing protein n=1 Tax=Lysobacter enzymogenes TaxID=69 RepID=UPI00089C65B1|nr:helix-turn-helix domain-containing protein [Lysobacter enzymogenes]SDW58152.1 AraC-type DNA-binding protein [Lysobacter enzymogenes]
MAPADGDDRPERPGVLADAAGRFRRFAPRRELRGHVEAIWRSRVADNLDAPLVIVPDARIDLIWTGAQLFVAGPDTGPALARLPPGARVTGFQFHPAAAGALLRAPMHALRDARVDFAEFVGAPGHDLAARAAEAGGDEAALSILQDGLARLLADAPAPDSRLRAVYARLGRAGDDGADLARLARAAGLSERSLRRRSLDAFGYGPRTLARILRFGRVMDALRARRGEPLAELAAALGYADQAHMSREVAAFSGFAPGEVRRQLAAPLAVSFKTNRRG